jgi:hypothetical protein
MIDDLQQPVFAVAGIIGIIVSAAVAYAIWRYKDRGQPIPEQTHGKPALEITLTVIPALILAVVGVFTFRVIFDLARTDDTQLVINVTGQQWWWEYDYPVQNEWGITQPIISSGQLVIPAGFKVLLRETSRDVIHSYWIPALNGKRDAVPGRVHTLRLEADQPGIGTVAGGFCDVGGESAGHLSGTSGRFTRQAGRRGVLEPVCTLPSSEWPEARRRHVGDCRSRRECVVGCGTKPHQVHDAQYVCRSDV